jgi:hypothetical protein
VPFARGESVEFLVRAKSGRDALGASLYTETPVEVTGCALWPGTSTEQVQAADTVTTRWTLALPRILPAGLAPTATDRVRVRGEVYEIDGTPDAYRSPLSGARPGLVLQLVRVTG